MYAKEHRPHKLHRTAYYKRSLSLKHRRRLQGKIRRRSLVAIENSAAAKLLSARQDDAFFASSGFDPKSFDILLKHYQPVVDTHTPYVDENGFIYKISGPSWRRILTAEMSLLLVLVWYRSRGPTRSIQMQFGLTHSVCCLWLSFGRRILVKVLKKMDEAKVRLPTNREVRLFQKMIEVKYPKLKNVWGAMDGLKIPLEKAGDNAVQNIFYNGWTGGTYITNLFLFSPDGKIRLAFINAPGSIHDSNMAMLGDVYNKIDAVYESTGGGRIVGDSAFCAKASDAIIKSRQSFFNRDGSISQSGSMFAQATAVRQLSEWGMRGLQGAFPRVKDRIRYEEKGDRKIFLSGLVLLYNIRAHLVGMNQIRTTFLHGEKFQAIGVDYLNSL